VVEAAKGTGSILTAVAAVPAAVELLPVVLYMVTHTLMVGSTAAKL